MYRLLRYPIALILSLLVPFFMQGQGQVPVATSAVASATGLPWSKPNTIHYVQDEDLASLLRTFCATQNMNALVDSHIYGKVNGRFDQATPQEFFDTMVRSYGLIWFYDGNVLYIDPGSAIITEIVQAHYIDAPKLEEMVKAMGFQSSNWSIRGMPGDGVIFLSGPPRFVKNAEVIASKLDMEAAQRYARKDCIRVFPLKYAWAHDLNIGFSGTSVVVPGVATLLTNLMLETSSTGGGDAVSARPFGANSAVPERQAAMTPMVGGSSSSESANVNPGSANKSDRAASVNSVSSDNASIQCDTRLNAVVIRDSEDRMPLYAQTIAQLDRPVSLIEINAAIVDVDAAYIQDLGNQYFTLSKNGNSASVNLVGPLNTVTNLTNNIAFQGLVNGVTFMSSIEALATNHHAQVLSRPSVLTLDNTQAIINRQQQFYIPVTSSYDASLFNVTPGMTLEVTPHLIVEPDSRKIKLLVNIQDGTIDTNMAQVSNLPVVSQSNITTQGIVSENLSLLIGGYYQKQNSKGTSGLPFLSQIPIIGLLFGNESRQQTVTNRMYLITPKVIESTPENSMQFNRYFEPPSIQKNVDLKPEPDGYLVPLPMQAATPVTGVQQGNRKASLADSDAKVQRITAVGPPR